MTRKLISSVALAAAVLLPLTFSNAMAHGKTPGKSCGYSGWHHPHGHGMSGWGHPYGHGKYMYKKHGHGHGYGKPGYRQGHGHPYYGHMQGYRKGYGVGHHGGYYMMNTGRYGSDYGRTATDESGKDQPSKSASAGKDIVDTAVSAGSFTTLVEAVKAAGLVDTLRGEGPFTVFAPTDEAFAKIPQDQLNALLQDKDKLTAILTYHVAPGKLQAEEIVKRASVKTVQGQSLTVSTKDNGVRVDDANVTKTDIVASNGIIHVIDTVVIPN